MAATGGLAGLLVRTFDRPAEQLSIDARFALRGSRAPSRSVAIVAFDNKTLRSLAVRPPLPRDIQAQVVDNLDAAGARVIAFDYSLEQRSESERQDRALVVALLNARRAVVSVTAPGPTGDVADLAGFVSFDDIDVRPGYTPLQLDPEGVVRRFRRLPRGLETFAVAAAEEFTGARHIGVPARALIDYPGPTGTFPALSYADVLRGRFDRAAVRDKIVVVGPTATVLDDGHRVPVDSTMPGPEIHAASIATALAGFPLRAVSARTAQHETIGAGLLLALALVGVALAGRAVRIARGGGGVLLDAPGPVAVSAVGALAAGTWLLLAQLEFNAGTVVELLPVLAALAASTAAALTVSVVVSRHARRDVRARFADREEGIVTRVMASTERSRAVTASDIIAGYVIERPIAGGGMGEVYSAVQSRLGRRVALKLIRSEHARDRAYRRRFVDEAHRASGLSHPNVITVIDAGDDDGVLFIAMQLVVGSNLGESLSNVGFLDAAYAVRLAHRIACALDAAHAEGVFHRDVKPANILIPDRSPEHPLLTDFGVARTAAESGRPAGVEGTLAYLAPERFDGRESGRAADVYALAAVLFECLTGVAPFPRDTREAIAEAHRSAARPVVSWLRPELGTRIDAVVATGLAIDPDARYRTATAFTHAAAEALGARVTDDERDAGRPPVEHPRATDQPAAGDDAEPTELG